MNNIHNKSNIISSLLWKLLERGGTQGIQFIVQIVLARLLIPEEFGTIAIVMVFINLAQVFVQSGFNTALIQKKEVDELDFSSIFYLSSGVALILYILMFILAPYIALFYHMMILKSVLRILSLSLLIGAFNSIQNAYIARNLLFKKLFKSSLAASLISGFLGIGSAFNGLGIWALVIQQISFQISIGIIMWFTVNWRPKLIFSFTRVKHLFKFGSNLLLSALLDTGYRELRTLIIGRIYSPETLGYYNRGQQFPQFIVSNIDGSIQSVMLPTLSAHQDNSKRVKEMMRRAIVSSCFIIFPLMIGMAVVAEPMVKIILTDKWLPAVPFLQIGCFSFLLWPIHSSNLQAINAMGRSDIFLKLEIFKKILGLIILGVSLPFGVYIIALGQVASGIVSSFINAYPNKKLLGYSYKEQWSDITPSLLAAFIMGGIVYLLKFLNFTDWQTLFLQVLVGISCYIGIAKIFKMESFTYLVGSLNQMFINKRSNPNV